MDTSIFEMSVFPNPMEDVTTISYTIPTSGIVKLSIYDASGIKIKTLLSEKKERGSYDFNFNSRNTSIQAGTHLLKLSIGDQEIVHRISIEGF